MAGHGVLELTAIFVAGGAGLLVGRALIAPGDLTRHDALVFYGRDAIRLVGASATLLVLAGLIEGFLSASDAPAAFKLGVSAASAGLVILYFAAGKRAEAQRPQPPLIGITTTVRSHSSINSTAASPAARMRNVSAST